MSEYRHIEQIWNSGDVNALFMLRASETCGKSTTSRSKWTSQLNGTVSHHLDYIFGPLTADWNITFIQNP